MQISGSMDFFFSPNELFRDPVFFTFHNATMNS